MIRYDLHCDQGHDFDGWFRNSEGFETLKKAGQVTCAICGSASVEKALMAPGVATRDLQTPRNPQETALEKLREQVEANSDYVGMSFAAEARAMHQGDAPSRAIHGEARLEDARKLLEDGIPVAPLPFRSRQRAN
ncbi:DUF1178 family protein [Paracoccus shanxieyensis]|uniref:DUF1178 family protein n=1 Tax=Paracoccus shanxieyensis TaxID=2675752 RepID=A0A6L6IWL0_9RHOB|nr:DUF1178 family protein [Paracoccus shanxieyensis]MTH62984.1 DUF1178 family protein [Paracoccus shanxieyensis]MTH85932.1 DUF1178 family protein [Paracoccus shanxieyensis]